MAIIVKKTGEKAEPVKPTPFTDESELQEYIHMNPDSLPLYEIDEDIKLVTLAREVPTESGPIDAFGVDKKGNIYIIETKRHANSDRRMVVAQVLDYGASLWRHAGDFPELLSHLQDAVLKKFKVTLNDKLKQSFGITDDDVAGLLNSVRENLSNGRFSFVVCMDEMDERLKDLIIFLNQNSELNIYGVELEYYKQDEYEILIPRLFGAEGKKPPTGWQWNEQKFLEKAKTLAQFAAVEKVYRSFGADKGGKVYWGKGAAGKALAKYGDRRLFAVTAEGVLELAIELMDAPEARRFKATSRLDFDAEVKRPYLVLEIGQWADKADTIVLAIDEFAKTVRTE